MQERKQAVEDLEVLLRSRFGGTTELMFGQDQFACSKKLADLRADKSVQLEANSYECYSLLFAANQLYFISNNHFLVEHQRLKEWETSFQAWPNLDCAATMLLTPRFAIHINSIFSAS